MHPKTARNPKGSGRPNIRGLVDWDKVEHLCYLGVSRETIAGYFGMSYETFLKAAHDAGRDMESVYLVKRSEGQVNLHERIDASDWGPMLIFRAKNQLGWRDESHAGHGAGAPPVQVNITFVTPSKLASGQAQGQVVEGQVQVLPALAPGQPTEPAEAELP